MAPTKKRLQSQPGPHQDVQVLSGQGGVAMQFGFGPLLAGESQPPERAAMETSASSKQGRI